MKKLLLPIVLCLLVMSQNVFAQTRPVKGRVLDEKGQPVPGASVQVKGTGTGTITDMNGAFSLDVPDEDNTLVITSIGYGTEEVEAGDGLNALTIKVQTATNVLGETVVTALGIEKEKRSLGYSVSDVSSEQIERSGERNVIEALAAKAPGLSVISSAGTPGASSQIILRGKTSFSGENQPLIVVDGIPIDNSTSQPTAGDYPFNMNLTGINGSNRGIDINPDDIESITVLKGPTAAVLYGEQGARGAIMITTKKGKYGKGNGLGITFTSSLEINKVSKLPKTQNQYAQGNGGVYSTGNTANSWGARIDTTDLKTYDNFDNFFQTGMGYNNTIGLTGGSDHAIIRASLGNYNTSGIIPNSKLNRTTLNLNAEAKLASWLTVGGIANYTYSESRMVQNGSNVAGTMLSLFRAPVTYDISKNYYDSVNHLSNNYFVYDNPLFSVYRNPFDAYTNRVLGNLYANADLLKGLSLSYKIGVDEYATQTRQIYDLGSIGNDASDGTGQLNKSSTNAMQVYSDLLLKYIKRFGDISLDAMVGHNYTFNESRYSFIRGYTMNVPNLYNLANYSQFYASNLDGYQRSQALFANITVGYKNMIYLTLAGRNEWNTGLGKGSKGFFYPKADLSWIFTEIMPKNNILTYGKLRMAIANAGISPLSYSGTNYYLQPFLTDGYTNGNGFPYNGVVGYMPSNTNQSQHLVPENTTGKEIGLELEFLKGRIRFEGTYYHQLSKDLLMNVPKAPSSGYVAEYGNVGKLLNTGVELALNGDVFKNKDWNINIGINWFKNTSKVLELGDGINELSIESGFVQIGSYVVVGGSYGAFYGTAWERNDAGQILVDDGGYPIIASTNKPIGDPNPDWLMNISGNFSYKGLTLTMLWDFRHGGDIWNGTWARMNNIGRTDESADREHEYTVDGVYAPGTANAGQKNTTPIPAQDYFQYVVGDVGAAENAIQDGGWIRLRAIGLSYRFSFPNREKTHNPFKYVELGVTGRNLFLSTKYKGVDPETSLTGAGSNLGGWDYFNNPGSKSYIINLKFGL